MSKRSILFGLALGALLGVLFAPKKGTEMREGLKRERDEGGMGWNTLQDAFTGMGEQIGDCIRGACPPEEMKEEAKRFVKKTVSGHDFIAKPIASQNGHKKPAKKRTIKIKKIHVKSRKK